MNTCSLFDEFNILSKISIITKIPLVFPCGSLITAPKVVSNGKKQSYSLNKLSQEFSPGIACRPSIVCTYNYFALAFLFGRNSRLSEYSSPSIIELEKKLQAAIYMARDNYFL